MEWRKAPPLSALRAFEAAARAGGFSAAARELNVTHAAVAQQVRSLESRLGAPLMRRDGRGLRLTDEGRRLADALSQGFEVMRLGLERFVDEISSRPVSVTLTPSFAAHWLTPRLGAFREAHPDVDLLLDPSTHRVDLSDGVFDVAIRFGDGDWPDVVSELLIGTPLVVLAAPGFLSDRSLGAPSAGQVAGIGHGKRRIWRSREGVDAAALLSVPWIEEIGTEEGAAWLSSLGLDPSKRRHVTKMPGFMAVEALRAGQGVGVTARIFVERELEAGRLIAAFETGEDGPTGYHIVRRDEPLRAPAAAFAAWLRAAARG